MGLKQAAFKAGMNLGLFRICGTRDESPVSKRKVKNVLSRDIGANRRDEHDVGETKASG